jgi:single-strand DNA-binding protein
MSTSAPAVNSITLVGHLTSDPVLRSLDDGRKVCDMRLAVNDQRDQPPLFIDVATFGPSAEACARYLAKGRQIAVTGRLIYREWEADDGSRRSKHAVIGRVRFGGRPNGQNAEGDDSTESGRNGDEDVDF